MTVIKIENLSKQYRLGNVGLGSFSHDANRWWHTIRGKEDPYLKIGDENERSKSGSSDYVWALRNINFEVKQGEVLGIIGRNGAGKSTLLKILSRTTSPTTGQIKVKGRIASLLEVGTGFHPDLTGRENIFLNGAILGMTKREIKNKLDEIIDFSGVERYIDTPVKRYSSGMYVRLAFAVAAHLEPELLIVDEVLSVGDSEFQKKALGKMKEVSSTDGRTVLFVSHNMAAIRNLCTRGLVLRNGNINFMGDVAKSISAYLVSETSDTQKSIEHSLNRTGNGFVTFADLYFENEFGERIDRIVTGHDLTLVFTVKVKDSPPQNIDIGFSFEDAYDVPLGNLYSSHQNVLFNFQAGYNLIKCTLHNFSFGPGKLLIRGRIMANGQESDWFKDMLAILDVEMGDFYETGQLGQKDWNSKFLFKGTWSA